MHFYERYFFMFWFRFQVCSCWLNWEYRQTSNYKMHLSRQWNCWSLRCSWSITCWRCSNYLFKLRSHMRGAVAERRRADFDIPAPLPRVCSYIRGADAGGSAISWGQWWFGARGFEAGAVNWVLDPFLAERFLLPLRDRACVNSM